MKISPEIVEQKLSNHVQLPFFLFGIQDEALGQKLIMVVEGSSNQLSVINQQIAACKLLEKLEVPKAVHFVKKILRNNGKFLRGKTVRTINTV